MRATSETPHGRLDVLLTPERRKCHTRSSSPAPGRRKFEDIHHLPYQDPPISVRSDSPQLALPVETDDQLAEWYEQFSSLFSLQT